MVGGVYPSHSDLNLIRVGDSSKMRSLVLITSIIRVPALPLSYTSTRSVYTMEERFEQTRRTIETVRERIPDAEIVIVECSELDPEHEEYLRRHSNHFLNLIHNEEATRDIYSISKSLGEGTMTIMAIEYIQQNHIEFDHFFKISGRYWLSEHFDYHSNFCNHDVVIRSIEHGNICTALYKLNGHDSVRRLHDFLRSSTGQMRQCIGYEILFGHFLMSEQAHSKIRDLPRIGVQGYISVSHDFLDF